MIPKDMPTALCNQSFRIVATVTAPASRTFSAAYTQSKGTGHWPCEWATGLDKASVQQFLGNPGAPQASVVGTPSGSWERLQFCSWMPFEDWELSPGHTRKDISSTNHRKGHRLFHRAHRVQRSQFTHRYVVSYRPGTYIPIIPVTWEVEAEGS